MFCDFGASCVIDERTKNPFCKCDIRCPKDVFAPVCGSNNITYTNECHLRNASCTHQARIFVKQAGECHLNDPCASKQCQFGATCQPSIDGRSSECVCPEKCSNYDDSRVSRQVCGSDGKDYTNVCELKKSACIQMKEITVKYYGQCDPCEGVECPASQTCQLDEQRNAICKCNSVCSQEIKTVCGSNGKTYGNECLLRVESCRLQRHIRVIAQQPCSTDSVTNPCKNLKCRANQECHINKQGIASCVCPHSCPQVMKPVCGTDGVTYDSECDLQRKACLNQTDVSIAYRGACDSEDHIKCQKLQCEYGSQCAIDSKTLEPYCACMFSCTNEYNPVCGSDGISYNNLCHLKKESCENKKAINFTFSGLCGGCENKICQFYSVCETNGFEASKCVCPTACLPMNDSVCGSDGKTYANECELRVAACKQQTHITVTSKGSCDLCRNIHCKYGARCEDGHCICPTSCPQDNEPICASDDRTYLNECEMRKYACETNSELNIKFYGECKESVSSQIDEEESSKEGSGDGERDGESNLNRVAAQSCNEIKCKFGANCVEESKAHPKCVCSFDCESNATSSQLICGSDGIFYENDCFLIAASCHKQQQLQIAPLDSCKSTTAVEVSNCRSSVYSCCPDGKTAAQGPKHAGCPTTCGCNRLGSFSMTCDPITNQCPCKPGVGGLKCDRCEPGFWGLHKISEGNSGCIHCSCNELGSVRDDCEQTTGRCVCKDGVLGMKCDHCAENEVLTADGCIFASGKRKSCKEITCNFGATCKEDDTRSASCICNFDCEDANLIPVCGSDNNTYGSECQMKLFSCRYQREIIIKNEGSCQMQFLVTPLPSPPLMYSTAPESASSSPLHNLFNLSSTSTPSSLSKSGSDAGHPNTQNFSGTTFIKPPYLKMARLNAFIRLSLEIEFQAFAENGIILFNGQTASGAGDFISLALRGGHVEFKYNLGSGQVVLRSHRKIDLQTRVRVAVRRYLRDGKLSVSGQQDVIGKSHGTMKNLDLGDYLYLANVPTDQKKIYELIGVKTGLFGCLFKFKIGSKTIDLKNFYFKFSKLKKKLIEDNQTAVCFCDYNCENAFSEPVCGSDNKVYKSECELKIASCETKRNLHVLNIGQCDDSVVSSPSNLLMMFSLQAANKTVIAPSPSITSSSYSSSHHLQRDAEFQSLTGPKTATLQIFSGFSYFKLQKIEAKHGLSLEVEFQPFSENGIILYNGQSFSGKGDFVSLAMRDSYVEFRFNLGSGLAILRSRQRLVLGSSVRVTAKRHLRDGKLSVAGQKDVLGKSPGSMKSLDLGDHLYLGGVPESEKRVYENIGLKNGFIGYMSKLKIGGKVVDLKRASLRHVKSKRALYTRRSMSSLFASRKDVLANG